MPPRTRSLIFGAVVLGALVAACGEAAPPLAPSPVASDASPTAPAASEAPGTAEILRFEAPNLAGGVLRGADYAGKDVAIWFWAPW